MVHTRLEIRPRHFAWLELMFHRRDPEARGQRMLCEGHPVIVDSLNRIMHELELDDWSEQ